MCACVICEMDTTELKQMEQMEQMEQEQLEQPMEQQLEQEQLEHRARAMRLKMNEKGSMWRWALRGIVIQ